MLTARDPDKGGEAANKLHNEGLNVTLGQLDVTDARSVEAYAGRLFKAGTEVDVRVNNAGAYPTEGVFSVSEETFMRALDINTGEPFRTCQAFVPAMIERGYGWLVNVSSGGGSFGEGPGPAAYAISKAALNALTAKISQALRGDVKTNAMCPSLGWVRTDMGALAHPVLPRKPRLRWFG